MAGGHDDHATFTACFDGLSKHVYHRHNKAEMEKAFTKLVRSEKYHQLESLYYNNLHQRHGKTFMDILQRILFVQEVKTTQEYNLDGRVIKVHVFEDTDL